MSKRIKLTRNKYALVDDEDFNWLNQWNWYAGRGHSTTLWYAVRHKEKTHTLIFMHRKLLKVPQGMMTDHINGNGLDNRRHNLRIVTNRQNQFNRHKLNSNNKSGFTGVSWYSDRKKWVASIGIGGTRKILGYFKNKDEAYKKYQEVKTHLLCPS